MDPQDEPIPGTSKGFEATSFEEMAPGTSNSALIPGEQEDEEIDKEFLSLIDSEDYIKLHGEKMIGYENQLFLDMLYSDGLVVVGK